MFYESNNCYRLFGRLSMENLKCPGCKKEYTDSNPPRLLTMCGHTYCQLCIKSMIKRKDYRFQIRCPEDKLKLTIDSQTPSQFPKNMVLIQHLNKIQPKAEVAQDKNEFLPNSGGDSVLIHRRYESKDSLNNSLFGSKRTSFEEGVCLLHQKPLDITCLQQKVQICAECALFGIHKGHTFTTIKELQVKRNQWIHSISHIMQEKKILSQKCKIENIKKEMNNLLLKKKASLFDEIERYINKIKGMLQKRQNELKSLIDDQIKKTELELECNVKIQKRVEQQFIDWECKIIETVDCLESEDVMKSLDFFSNLIMQKQENFILKGEIKINDLKVEIDRYWMDIEKKIQFPKLKLNGEIEEQINKSIEIVTAMSEMFSKVYISSTLSIDIPQFKDLLDSSHIEQVSLLDVTDNFKNQNYYSTIVDTNFDKSILMQSSFLQNTQKSMEKIDILPKTLQKVKSNECLFTGSVITNTNKRNMFRSPKNQRLNTVVLSKGNLPASASPVFMKNKLKRSIFKVKDPERFERTLQALELDNLQIVDFTGLEMGDQIVRDVCLTIKQCSKVRSLRLMKNQLSDESIPSLLEVISNLQVLNLAQNSFTTKLLQELIHLAKNQPVKKTKSIQLGQNSINPRKIKQKIQQLKRYGYFISL